MAGNKSRPSAKFLLENGLLLSVDLQLSKFLGDGCTVPGCRNFLVDVQDLSILTDVKSPPLGNESRAMDNAVFGSHFPTGVAQNGIVDLQLLSELRVSLHVVTAGCEIFHVKRTNSFAVLTERNALFSSATGEGFGVPCHYHSLLAFKV